LESVQSERGQMWNGVVAYKMYEEGNAPGE